jgi:phosphoribosylformylglycinamidine synthase PurS subunit
MAQVPENEETRAGVRSGEAGGQAMAKARVIITLKRTIMDAQGQTVEKALHNLGYEGVQNLRIGKYIEMEVDGAPKEQLSAQLDEMCRRLLANPIIEDFQSEIEE